MKKNEKDFKRNGNDNGIEKSLIELPRLRRKGEKRIFQQRLYQQGKGQRQSAWKIMPV
jgi:hypothetical protein